jgi:hypothetical protein
MNGAHTADREADKQAIRELVENWAIWRDAGFWEKFSTVWHTDGLMMATWFQGSARTFIEKSRRGFEDGVRILHFLGGSSMEVVGDRSIAQTKMTITQRVVIEGVSCDVICTGRFYDFFERRAGKWGLVLRQPIYERDRIQSVGPQPVPQLDHRELEALPEGYRHLAYVQRQLGFTVKSDMPQLVGASVEALYRAGERWLAGEAPRWPPA